MKVIIDIEPNLFNNVVKRTHECDYMSDVWLAVGHGKPYEERPQGEWIDPQNFGANNWCSICGKFILHYVGIANCGADMRGNNNG